MSMAQTITHAEESKNVLVRRRNDKLMKRSLEEKTAVLSTASGCRFYSRHQCIIALNAFTFPIN